MLLFDSVYLKYRSVLKKIIIINLLLLRLWRYNSDTVLAFSTISFRLRRSCTCSAHFISFIFFTSFLTSSSHRDLGLPVNGFHLCILFTMLVSGILFVCPKPTQSLGFNIIYYVPVFNEFIQLLVCFNSPNTVGFLSWPKYFP